jgi:hypothetical protein
MTTLNEAILKERERIHKKFGYVANHRYYILVNGCVPRGFETDDIKEAKMMLIKAMQKLDPNAVIIDNADFGTYPDVERLAIRLKMNSGYYKDSKSRSTKRRDEYVPNKGKYQSCTLIPMIHWEWGVETMVFVDKDDPHPDPLNKLTWGYDVEGNMYPGDYNERFTRVGKSFAFQYSIAGAWTGMQEKELRHRAIIKAIKEYMGNMVQLRKVKTKKKIKKVNR